MTGMFNPSPMHFGAEEGSRLELIFQDLLLQRGTAFSSDEDGYAYAETFAKAKAIDYLFSLGERFVNETNVDTTRDFLKRFEFIYGITPLKSDSLIRRRQKLKMKMELQGKVPTLQNISDLLTVVLGEDVFDGIIHTPSSDAYGQVPGGATIPGGVTLVDGSWYSSICHIDIKLVQPSYMDDYVFYKTKAQIPAYLDDFLPAWVTYEVIKDGVHGIGFFLDEPGNLDNQRFA